jgi:sporulation protein YlmC with PRC-barrel domain
MYRTTSVMALGLFLGLAPVGALAQTTTDQTQTQQQLTTEPTAPETQQQATEPTAPETQQQMTEPTAPETDEPAVATDVDEPAMDIIAEQDEEAMLASTIIGSSVMLADESIGTVSDLIIDADERLHGVLVGVGGFLGIGEKRVALPMDRITIRRPEPGQVELTADITREELEEKEAFKTASQIRAEREAEQAEQMQQQPMQQPLQ